MKLIASLLSLAVYSCMAIDRKGYIMSISINSKAALSYFQSIRPKIDLILGSGSQTRQDILRRQGFQYTIKKASIDEKEFGDRSYLAKPAELVRLLAEEKANSIMSTLTLPTVNSSSNKHLILLTADQVVTCDGMILEKPVDLIEARCFINRYNGRSCSTVGSIALTDLRTGIRVSGVDTATIYFKSIPHSIIEEILCEGLVLGCAGGLMVEHPLLQEYIEKIEGTVDSVMGLSCELLQVLFEQLKL
jgi:septum formation protein